MLGIEDKGVLAAYLLSIASAILCLVYGYLHRNKGDEPVQPTDVKWVAEEKKVEDKF
ncbi:MAG: symporter small accessory protein [Anaerohalosphaeraceae bacterium]